MLTWQQRVPERLINVEKVLGDSLIYKSFCYGQTVAGIFQLINRGCL